MDHKLYMMIGLPGSGKSTIAQEMASKEDAIIVSYDKIKEEVFKNENKMEDPDFIYRMVEEKINDGLIRGNVIYDARNIDYKKRRQFLSMFTNVKKIAILVATPYEECLKRSKEEFNVVSEDKIKKMYYSFYIPQKYEGFNDINIIYNTDLLKEKYLIDDLLKDIDIAQDNPHHTLSIKDHCLKAYEYVLENNADNEILTYATLLHDIGKKETKTFINKKGEETEIAHYYDHQYVGAYLALFYLNSVEKDKVLEICNLIQWHMLVDNTLSEKTKEKYKKMLGNDAWENLQKLHEADMHAK